MLFSLESDTGDLVRFYVAPDAFSEIPSVIVCGHDRELMTLEANEVRDAMVMARRHATGWCGFRIDLALLPDLPQIHDLVVYEKSSGIMIYRRPESRHIQKKIFRIETSLFPQHGLDKFLIGQFQQGVQSIEKFGLESSTQLFLIANVSSIYLSGRLLYNTYSFYIEDRFETFICIDDPYLSLAERLLIMSRMDDERGPLILGERDFLLFRSAIAFAKELKFDDSKSLRRMLRSLPEEIAVALVNPLTRQLTCSTPDEMPRRGAVAAALDRLSTYAIVGLRQEERPFKEALGAFIGIEAASIPLAASLPSVTALAQILREEARVNSLIESDLEIYTYVHDAHQVTSP